MPDLQKEIPAYLMLKSNIVRLILFTAFFALIFINVYAPFGLMYGNTPHAGSCCSTRV
jgi:hypothetical protein